MGPTGVIPAQFRDQLAAQRLAMCNDIGEAAYTDSLIAAALYEHLARLPKVRLPPPCRCPDRQPASCRDPVHVALSDVGLA